MRNQIFSQREGSNRIFISEEIVKNNNTESSKIEKSMMLSRQIFKFHIPFFEGETPKTEFISQKKSLLRIILSKTQKDREIIFFQRENFGTE